MNCSLPVMFVVTLLTAGVIASCSSDDAVRTSPNQGTTPTMVTLGVDTYVSDSGYVKYHAVTDIWEMYDNTDTPYWRFPHPLVIDILDKDMSPSAHIECDSAIYKTVQQLFRFDGDVTAINVLRDTFLTAQLYWDQKTSEFYTDSFIHIVKTDRVLEGYGFRSNDRMTVYTINNPTAILPSSAFRREENQQTQAVAPQPDSTSAAQTNAPERQPIPEPASRRVNQEGYQIHALPDSIRPGTRTTPMRHINRN